MASCSECGRKAGWLSLHEGGICDECFAEAAAFRYQRMDDLIEAERAADEAELAQINEIILTTESSHDLPILQRLDIVTAEVVVGMHLFKDVAAAFRDVFGGRSSAMQNGLRDARVTALTELRREALALGADAVVGVDLDYSEISGGGKSMLFLVASGTAVTLAKAVTAH